VEMLAGQGRAEGGREGTAGFLYLPRLWFRRVKGAGQSLFPYALPKVRLANGSQVRRRGVTGNPP